MGEQFSFDCYVVRVVVLEDGVAEAITVCYILRVFYYLSYANTSI